MSDEIVNKDKVTILAGDPVHDFWLKGAVNRYPGYTFQAKVYDVGSVFGIGQGRISKLQVWRGDRLVMHYDRGWDKKPVAPARPESVAGDPGGVSDRQAEKTNNEAPVLEQKSRRRFAFGKVRRSGKTQDNGDYER